ncbi:MAG: tetratricopeptide repeat protein [Rhodospirillales bacterium]
MRLFGLGPPVASLLGRIGGILLRAGELDAAAMAYGCAVKADAGNIAAHIKLSALQHWKGRAEKARETLERGIREKPFYVRPCPNEPLGHVMTVRGVEGGHYMVGWRHNEERKVVLRGGNISDRHLIDRDRFTKTNFFVFDDNLLSCPDLPTFDIIVNTIADPDLEPRALGTVSAFLRRHPEIPVINHPDRVLETTRDNNHRRLKDVPGLLVPKTVRVAGAPPAAADVIRAMDENGLSFPILVRETGSHTGHTLRRFDDRATVERGLPYQNARELYVTQYVESLFKGPYFRKMRLFFVDGETFPVVCHIDTEWNVHGDNRTRLMAKNQWMMDEEKAFMADPRAYLGPARMDAVRKLYSVIGLDFFGLDFTLTGGGDVLVYEVNPVMMHGFDHARHFPYLTPYLENVSEAFNRMIAARLRPT